MLVGTKSDLEIKREIQTEEAIEYANEEGMMFVETSALSDSNINEAFRDVAASTNGSLHSNFFC
jgi:GTPase SAR1 family protein